MKANRRFGMRLAAVGAVWTVMLMPGCAGRPGFFRRATNTAVDEPKSECSKYTEESQRDGYYDPYVAAEKQMAEFQAEQGQTRTDAIVGAVPDVLHLLRLLKEDY